MKKSVVKRGSPLLRRQGSLPLGREDGAEIWEIGKEATARAFQTGGTSCEKALRQEGNFLVQGMKGV